MLRRSRHQTEVYALLKVSEEGEKQIADWLLNEIQVPQKSIYRRMHLTVYYSRRSLPHLQPTRETVNLCAETSETRFMVLAPGGENPRKELVPRNRSVGIRLTRRSSAISQIQELRKRVYSYETKQVTENRKPTTAWTNCFGARHFQPHIKLLFPGSGVPDDLSVLGKRFRFDIVTIKFDRFEIVIRKHNSTSAAASPRR